VLLQHPTVYNFAVDGVLSFGTNLQFDKPIVQQNFIALFNIAGKMGVNVSAPSLTEKDRRDLNFGIKVGVDYFALSFVRHAEDLKQIKQIIKKQGHNTPVVAKIEKPEAVDNLDEILEVTDAIMVARGDLGVEAGPMVATIFVLIIIIFPFWSSVVVFS